MSEAKKPQSPLAIERGRAAREIAQARGLDWNNLSQEERKALRLEAIPPKPSAGPVPAAFAALQPGIAQLEERLLEAERRSHAVTVEIAKLKVELLALKTKVGLAEAGRA
jgi:hypothetical protein